MCPYKNAILTDEQQSFNTGVSSVGGDSIGWGFGKIVQLFAFVDFLEKNTLKSRTCGQLASSRPLHDGDTNDHLSHNMSCLYGSQVST